METKYALIAGALITLAGFYFPFFKDWYKKLTSDKKQTVMLVAIFVAVAGRFALSCTGQVDAYACSLNGGWDATADFVMAIVANAGIYKGVNYLADKRKLAK
jgi:hypothetical protein